MDDIIYILLGVVWIAYTFYRYNKKKKEKAAAISQKSPVNIESGKESNIFGEVLSDLLGEEKTVESQAFDSEYEYSEPSISSLDNLEDAIDKVPESEGVSVFSYDDFDYEYTEQMMKDKSEVERNSDLSDFDLRKAIIFSEILRRPYY